MTNSPKIKIIFIITGLFTGGAEMMLYKLFLGMDREFFEPVVILLLDNGGSVRKKIEALDVPVYSLRMRHGLPTPRVLLRLRNLVRKCRPDLIQGWMYHGNIAAWLAAKMSDGQPRVFWNIRHSVYDITYEKRLTRLLIRLGSGLSSRVDAIIYNSATSRRQHEALGYDAARSVVIPNGFDTDIFCPNEEARRSVRQELGIADSVALVGLIGRYHPMKDHENFLKAAKIILVHNENVRFLLAGLGVDSTNKALMAWVKEHDVQNYVFLLGERSDIARLTAALDISSSSSCGEAFPNVIGEAMTCGVPCVVTDVGDSAWIVGNTGRVAPPRNSQALAENILMLLDLPKCERKALGNRARKRIEKNFTLDKIVRQYESLYIE